LTIIGVISYRSTATFIDRCLEAGMEDYIAKPVKPRDLQAALERWALLDGAR
jgi:CheY-like chemotaxis protein